MGRCQVTRPETYTVVLNPTGETVEVTPAEYRDLKASNMIRETVQDPAGHQVPDPPSQFKDGAGRGQDGTAGDTRPPTNRRSG